MGMGMGPVPLTGQLWDVGAGMEQGWDSRISPSQHFQPFPALSPEVPHRGMSPLCHQFLCLSFPIAHAHPPQGGGGHRGVRCAPQISAGHLLSCFQPQIPPGPFRAVARQDKNKRSLPLPQQPLAPARCSPPKFQSNLPQPLRFA